MNAHERKILNFLNDVYLTTKDDYTKVTLRSFIKKHRVSASYGKVLNENFLHSKHSGKNSASRLYKWRSIKPNLKMVNKARTEARNDNSKSMIYPKNNSKKQIIMNAQQKRVLGFLNELYDLTKDDFINLSIAKYIEKHNQQSYLGRIVFNNFLEKRKNGRVYYYKWKTIKPNLKMVDKCNLECREHAKAIYIKRKNKLIKGDSKIRLDFINFLKLRLSDGYHRLSLRILASEHGTNRSFCDFLTENDYILIKDKDVGPSVYKYKWNDKKSFTELKKLILEADISKGKEPMKKLETKVVEPKQENTIQIQVYENIIRTLNNDLDSKEKQIEELGKKLSLKTKRITKKVEPTQKNITILWGLIKIKY